MNFLKRSFEIVYIVIVTFYLIQVQVKTTICNPQTQLTQFLQESHTFMFSKITKPSLSLNQKLLPQTLSQKFILPFDKKIFKGQITPQLAYTVHQYDCFSIKEFNYLIFFNITIKGLQFEFVSIGMIWNKIKVQFWLNSRSDLVVGTVHLQNINFKQNLLQQQINLPIRFSGATKSNTIFINMIGGLKFEINTLNYNVKVSKYLANETVYIVQISKSSDSLLSQIIFSFFIFNPGSTFYSSKSGQMAYQSFGSFPKFIKILPNFAPIKFFIIGLNEIIIGKQNNQNHLKMEFSIDNIGIVFANSQTIIQKATLVYLAIGVSPQKVCDSCGVKTSIDSQNSSICVQSCPLFAFKEKNICVYCSSKIHQVLNQQKTKCQCQQGYKNYSRSNICIKIQTSQLNRQQQPQNQCFQSNTIQLKGKCICIPGSYNISGVCTFCQQNQIFNGKRCKLPKCSNGNQIRNSQGFCVCATGFIRNQLNLCVPTCPLFSIADKSDPTNPDKCQCVFGYYNITGSCQPCLRGQIYNLTTRKCL